ncbi:MAG: ATP-dependent zinc metalloprotease FtsH, partial [Ruminococcus sp.]|nr:ATP-dependent zinc metalloprotease FtsH [Ruminococcus sp.]
MTPKKNKGIFTYLLIIFVAIGCIWFVSSRLSKNADKKNYSEIMVEFDNYNVSEYEIDLGTGELNYKLRGDDKEYKYEVPNVSLFMEDIKNYRATYNRIHPDEPIKENLIKITDRSWIYSLIPVIVTVLLGCAILYFMMRQ